ncbi:hypothetical protein niasHS_014805 [Heterodera schachtii]|uniref:AMP-activated protein kinase glycogen-binding domain-containing protein n=1 Tax=Heterodera schachtii TaxID=97005 RepID=A0ABD2J096_HETSC
MKNLADRILRFPSFRKQKTKSKNDHQHRQSEEVVGETKGAFVMLIREVETKLHQTERNKELEEMREKEHDEHQQPGKEEKERGDEAEIGLNDEEERATWTTEDGENEEMDEARKGRTDESELEERVDETEKKNQEREWLHRQRNGEVEKKTQLERGQKEHNFKFKDEEKEAQMADENESEQRSLERMEKDMESIHMNGGHQQEEVEKLQMTLRTLEEKLRNTNQEKDYYKKHFKGENGGTHNGNGRGQLTDDFGKELLMANKRKYQLENRTKQLELELRETQQRCHHLGESVKSMEKLLWLEKERSATLEREREQLRGELGELRRHGDALKRELAELSGEEGVGGTEFSTESHNHQETINRMRAEFEQQYNEMRDLKNKVEWRLGEVTQQYHDTKWRLGEVEATLAHRDWELEQANSRIKQLETSVAATPSATLSDELERLKEELARKTEENGKMESKFGEVNQWWNDAKWRVGELEAETAHRSHLLDRAHHRIGELERRLANNLSFEDLRREKETLEGRVAELTKALDDAKWRVGELEAEMTRKDNFEEQKRKLEWRLGEMTQWWNDAKWRIGELEATLGHEGSARNNRGEGNGDENLAETLGRFRELLRDGVLLIRKQSHLDRHKWKMMKYENALEKDVRLRSCWFEVDSEGHQEVFLIGTFVNWECALLCEQIPEKPSRRGIWLDLPPGRYEFRFLRDGLWHTERKYGECWNEHGTKNNWINVE